MYSSEFSVVDYPEPHWARTREILKKYPQVRDLFGIDPSTAIWTVALVVWQLGIAALLRDASWWIIVLVAWFVGAFISHALFVIIHECAHNLVLRGARWNKITSIFANAPMVVPSAIAFRNFHLLHHRYQGEMKWDADLPGPVEAAWVGNSSWRKILWMLSFSIVEGFVRPVRVNRVNFFEPWALFNLLVVTGTVVLVIWTWGWWAALYLTLSTLFSVGLHPVGARWIQEHYTVKPPQETYSYYGPMNRLAFNVGYHNEHHDFMMVPWSRLPELRALAPEYYDSLYSHRSWPKLLWRFLFDRNLGLHNRVIRPDHVPGLKRNLHSGDTEKVIEAAKQEVGAPSV